MERLPLRVARRIALQAQGFGDRRPTGVPDRRHLRRVLARTPAARWGAIDDFAGIAVFLASPASDFVAGTAIPVDGGYSVMG